MRVEKRNTRKTKKKRKKGKRTKKVVQHWKTKRTEFETSICAVRENKMITRALDCHAR